MKRAQQGFKAYADRGRRGDPKFKVGDLVWLSTVYLKLSCPSGKLGQRFLGPFPIIRQINSVAFQLKLPASWHIHPVFHTALLKPASTFRFPGRTAPPPLPVVVDGQEEFEVEEILDSRLRGKRLQYLVKWKGFGLEENSWEPVSNIHTSDLLEKFHGTYPGKPSGGRVLRPLLDGGQCEDSGLRSCRRRRVSARRRVTLGAGDGRGGGGAGDGRQRKDADAST
ncbi:uncharacterized protein LOC121399951 [Xenopus laevis]|uniref:Uncharacterized protein LOC121399951 n=1 Tax=Xenopus laevis TaxID=8355 RepID=A0A8J1MA21_XENLA|nr:uncharacterized protein LOC121399951 [Xenopus laevis]